MKRNKKAFSLIELLLVIFLLVILAAMIIPKLSKASKKVNIVACQGNLRRLVSAFQQYVADYQGYAPFSYTSGEYKPSASSISGSAPGLGDWFLSYEAIYLLGPYFNDSDHKKFYNGTLESVRCPGNKSTLYDTGEDYIDINAPSGPLKYPDYFHNRQAPEDWDNDLHSVPMTHRTQSTTKLSPGRQIVDYQYNQGLGGAYTPLRPASSIYGLPGAKRDHRLNEIMRFPKEAVVFADIQYSTVLVDPSTADESGPKTFEYGYNLDRVTWNTIGGVAMRTNELIHGGTGINAVFYDGHVEFLKGLTAYNGSGNPMIYDDLYSWGISHAIREPDQALLAAQIPGIHGFRRKSKETLGFLGSWCIEHEFNAGEKRTKYVCIGGGV